MRDFFLYLSFQFKIVVNNRPIGFFDSGVGGTSIWKEVIQLLPHESTIYLADSKNAPYGEKSNDAIIALSKKNTELLISKGCKLIVVACNTATTNAISYLRTSFDIPFIGIEPAIKPAALLSKTEAIGILATKGTLSSKLFESTASAYTEGIITVEQDGEGLVSLIEDGKLDSKEMNELLQRYLIPMLEFNIDHLVLGCSHYPYLIPAIKKIVGPDVQIIDSGQAVARQTKAVLLKKDLLSNMNRNAKHVLFSNSDISTLQHLTKDVNAELKVALLDF